jgi:hypothetical protein
MFSHHKRYRRQRWGPTCRDDGVGPWTWPAAEAAAPVWQAGRQQGTPIKAASRPPVHAWLPSLAPPSFFSHQQATTSLSSHSHASPLLFFFVFSYYTLRRSSSATASSAAEKRLPLRAPLPPFHLLPRDSPPFRLVCRVQIVKVSDPPFSIILLPWQTQAMNRPAAPVASTAVLSPSHRWVAPYHHSTPISWVSTF